MHVATSSEMDPVDVNQMLQQRGAAFIWHRAKPRCYPLDQCQPENGSVPVSCTSVLGFCLLRFVDALGGYDGSGSS